MEASTAARGDQRNARHDPELYGTDEHQTGQEGAAREGATALTGGVTAMAAGGTAGIMFGAWLGGLTGFLVGTLLGVGLGESKGFWAGRARRK